MRMMQFEEDKIEDLKPVDKPQPKIGLIGRTIEICITICIIATTVKFVMWLF